jgi:hypothetical protein
MALDQQSGNFSPSERIVSPGVFTREIDQSFLAQGVEEIGGVVVAPFSKGPGFSPTVISSEAELVETFGAPDGNLYGSYTAQQYLREQGQVTVVRVGGLAGYEQKNPLIITAVPGTYPRTAESGSVTGVVSNTTITYVSEDDPTGPWNFIVTGSLIATFTSGIYNGQTLNVGTIQFDVSAPTTGSGNTLGTGSYGFDEITIINSSLPHAFGDDIVLESGSLFNYTVVNCGKQLQLTSGVISGNYGAFYGPFTASQVSLDDGCGVIITGSEARDEVVLAVLADSGYDVSQNLFGFSASAILPIDGAVASQDYELQLRVTNNVNQVAEYGVFNFSIDPNSSNYIGNVFASDPKVGYDDANVPNATRNVAYLHTIYDEQFTKISSEIATSGSWMVTVKTTNDATVYTDNVDINEADSLYSLTNASTPWINSQKMGTWLSGSEELSSRYNLFKVHTLSDGSSTNKLYKIEISNVRSPGSIAGTDFGSFTIGVRDYNDNDRRPRYLERYDNLNLDPNSANFIARRVGDSYNYIDYKGKIFTVGDYPTRSKYIRVEMAELSWPATVIPYGFDAYASTIGGTFARRGTLPKMTYTTASTYSLQPGRYASGVVFNPAPSGADAELAGLYPNGSRVGSERDNKQYFNPVPVGASIASNERFDLEDDAAVSPLFVAPQEAIRVRQRKFVLGFQGGFDGQSPSVPLLTGDDILPTNTQGLNLATSTSIGSVAYRQAIAALSNADEWDFNLITTPGVIYSLHPYVVTLTLDMVERRGDAFYIFDIEANQPAGGSSIQNVINRAQEFDTNYAATYYPWVRVIDTNTNRLVTVPPSVAMMAVFAANDRVSAEWFAPAGLNRGGIPSAVQVVDRLTHVERDELYEGKVNPIAAFPGQGIVAWGQKTLQRTPSALDRINVRRLLIALKKFIASSSRFLVFEQNVAATRNRFLSIVNPYLESVQQRSGLFAFRVVMDDTNNTPDMIDRGILYGQIYIQPTRVAEFIAIDFNILPTGATFPNA